MIKANESVRKTEVARARMELTIPLSNSSKTWKGIIELIKDHGSQEVFVFLHSGNQRDLSVHDYEVLGTICSRIQLSQPNNRPAEEQFFEEKAPVLESHYAIFQLCDWTKFRNFIQRCYWVFGSRPGLTNDWKPDKLIIEECFRDGKSIGETIHEQVTTRKWAVFLGNDENYDYERSLAFAEGIHMNEETAMEDMGLSPLSTISCLIYGRRVIFRDHMKQQEIEEQAVQRSGYWSPVLVEVSEY